MPATDLDLLKEAAAEAGEIALRFFRSDPQVWDKGGNAGPVTEADLAVNAHLKAKFNAVRPDYGWLSEETEDAAARLKTERQIVVDPIDGTRAFINGSHGWAHSIALVEAGRPIAAIVAMPAKGVTYSAAAGSGAFKNESPLVVAREDDLERATVVTAKPNLSAKNWQGGVLPGFNTAFRSSLAYRLCLVAEGRFDAMLTLRPTWEWDVAAGTLIVEEAHGRVSDREGLAPLFNNPHPQLSGIVAANPILSQRLSDALA